MDLEDIYKRIDTRLPNSALRILKSLENAGFEAYFVGGFIRDSILDREAYDIDIATDALWQQVRDVALDAGFKTYESGIKHGTITVIDPDEGLSIEVTTYRTEGAYTDSRHPDKVEFVSSIEEDLSRRDFTMNAIAYNPDEGIKDPFDGMGDIGRKLIRVVGDGRKRFAEDGLRILRAARFSSQLGFSIETNTFKAMLSNKSVLRNVSTERITHELDQLLLGDNVFQALMDTVDVISFVLPELVAMKGCEQVTKYHIYDVFEHTAHAVRSTKPNRLNRWVALCHDMGKPASAFFDDSGVEHFYGHAFVSIRIAKGMLKRLLMSPAFIDDVCKLIRYHDAEIAPTTRSVKKMLHKLDDREDLLRALLDMKRADALAQAPMCAERIELIDSVEDCLDAVLDNDEAFALRDLAINGADLLALGLPEGPIVGDVLADALDAVIDEIVMNEKDPLLEYVGERYL